MSPLVDAMPSGVMAYVRKSLVPCLQLLTPSVNGRPMPWIKDYASATQAAGGPIQPRSSRNAEVVLKLPAAMQLAASMPVSDSGRLAAEIDSAKLNLRRKGAKIRGYALWWGVKIRTDAKLFENGGPLW
jgi:hypothetical protein